MLYIDKLFNILNKIIMFCKTNAQYIYSNTTNGNQEQQKYKYLKH